MGSPKTERLDLAHVLARYGADLGAIFAQFPQPEADALIDELAAGVKEAADEFRKARARHMQERA